MIHDLKLETTISQSKSDHLNSTYSEHHESDQSISRASYMCRKCKVHGKLVPVKRHKRTCLYMHCKCIKCLLVDQGRKVVARQIALYRDQKHINPDERNDQASMESGGHKDDCMYHHQLHHRGVQEHTSRTCGFINQPGVMIDKDPVGPHCRRCRNHNVTVIWKNHKKACPYRHCPCDPCRLINVRKDTEKTLRDMQIVTDDSSMRHNHKSAMLSSSAAASVSSVYSINYSAGPTHAPPPPPPFCPPQTHLSTHSDQKCEPFPFYCHRPMHSSASPPPYYPSTTLSPPPNASNPFHLHHQMNNTFQRLVSATTPSTTQNSDNIIGHMTNGIATNFSAASDLFCSVSPEPNSQHNLPNNCSFRNLMCPPATLTVRPSHNVYQPTFDYTPTDMWNCFSSSTPRSNVFSYPIGVPPSDYPSTNNSAYSYLHSLGMSTTMPPPSSASSSSAASTITATTSSSAPSSSAASLSHPHAILDDITTVSSSSTSSSSNIIHESDLHHSSIIYRPFSDYCY